MSKKVNKSERIREMRKANPTMPPKEMAATLAKEGVKVTAAFVSTVLSGAKKKGGVVGKPGSADKALRRAAAARLTDTFSREELVAAKMLLEASSGRLDIARETLGVVSELVD